MQAQTLFVLGLVAGALVVFGIRAVSLEDAAPAPRPSEEAEAAHDSRADEHAMHDVDHAAPPQPASPHGDARPSADASAHAAVADRPPENTVCPVMGNPVKPGVFIDYEDRRIGFCCPGCDEVFMEDPAKYLKKVDAEIRAREEDASADAEGTLDPDRAPENAICPVMGNPVDPEIYVDHEGRRIGFCCPGCDALFLENPEKYLKKVDAELREREER